MHWDNNYNPDRRYQLVIMDDKGRCCCVGRLFDFEDVQKEMKKLRDIYAECGITHQVGYREV